MPETMPESRGRGLRVDEVKGPQKLGEDVLAVYRRAGEGYENVLSQFRAATGSPRAIFSSPEWSARQISPWPATAATSI